jgi:PAS domain S-box-containing protein
LRGQELVEKLRKSEDHFRVALKNAPIMIYTCDADLKFTWIHNLPASLETTDFIGKSTADIFDAASAKEIIALKRQVLTTGVGVRAMKQVQIAGQEISYDLTIEPLFNAAGRISGLTVSCIDVTERLRAEIAQRKAMEVAELANHAKTRFLSNMSHEMRTPLGVIQGFSELALDPAVSEAERQEFLQTIKRNATELTKLIGEILDLAKIESGHSETEIMRFSLVTLVEEVVSALSLQAKEKGIALTIDFKAPFPHFVKSDPTRVRQVLLNLLSNAIKFTSRGGVHVDASVHPSPDSNISMVIFDIKDSGIGLSPEHRERLFQAFSQADSSTTRKFGGTGLGLDLSRRLAQSMGGDVDLEFSEIGVGSTFRFKFDGGVLTPEDYKSPESVVVEKYTSAKFANKLRGLNVLLVDDSIDNQRLFSRYLKQTGADVTVASDGLEAIELGRSRDFHVILMDVQMPQMDGYEATAKLRSLDIDTPIIAITAHALKEEREKALEEGFNGYLIKPLEPVNLVYTLEKFLR